MKTKILVLIAAVALVTLSFVTINNDHNTEANTSKANRSQAEEPVGGFVSADAL